MAWVAGNQLQGGKYTIERELGRGRFGITYLAKNKNGDRQVIKTLNDDLLNSLSLEDRGRLETMFWQEAVKLSRCQHEHIVQVAEPFKEKEHWCLVMEYVDGVSLADRRQPILSEPEALRYNSTNWGSFDSSTRESFDSSRCTPRKYFFACAKWATRSGTDRFWLSSRL
jgi:serine/threonine protein kinase